MANDAVEWLATVSKHCRKSRIGDLSRHIGFCDPNDWYDMVLFDVPDILAKAEAYAVETHADKTGGIEVYLHARFRPRLELALRADNPDFHALILACSVDLATLFKRKSGAADDSDGEIGRVFNRDNPVLMVPAQIQSETERNIQRGTLMLMQGWRAFIRNPHAHEECPTDREYMVHALMLMSFLARIIDGATRIEPAPAEPMSWRPDSSLGVSCANTQAGITRRPRGSRFGTTLVILLKKR